MESINERISHNLEKSEQLEHQYRAKAHKQKYDAKKLDSSRKIIIANLFMKHFPETLQFQPHKTKAENRIEFLPFDIFFFLLASDKDYITSLWEKANELSSSKIRDNQQPLLSLQQSQI